MSEVLDHCRRRWRLDERGELLLGATPVSDALAIVGGTPAYLYSREIVAESIRDVRAAIGDAELFYSIKANPFGPLVDFVAGLVDGFDTASTGELGKALCAGKSDLAIQLSGPGKSGGEIAAAVAAGVLLNVESAGQVSDAAAAGARSRRPVNLVLRVNPRSLPGFSGLRMGGASSQFGIDLDDAAAAVALCRQHQIEPLGFHFYWGTQCLEGERIAAAQQQCWRVAQELSRTHRVALRYLNLGGGFGIPYFRGDSPLALAPVSASLARIAAELRSLEPGARLVVELGRYLVGAAGAYVVTVLDVKRSGAARIAVTDGGMHQHLAASGNLGQGLPRSFPCFTPADMNARAGEEARVVGRLCTPIDLLCAEALLPPLEPGDLLALFQSGAYGASASPQQFLGHEPVSEILL